MLVTAVDASLAKSLLRYVTFHQHYPRTQLVKRMGKSAHSCGDRVQLLPESKYATPVDPVQRNLFTIKKGEAPIGAHHSFPRSAAPYNSTMPCKLHLVDQTQQS